MVTCSASTSRSRWLAACSALALVGLPTACITDTPHRTLIVPEEMKRPTAQRVTPGATPNEPARYVVRMSEGGRVWELELPEASGGYQVAVPLAPSGPTEEFSAADEEVIADQDRGAEGGAEVKTPAALD